MKLKSLELHNYRRFATLKIGFHDQLTVLIGTNGAGKTTILDAAAVAIGSLFTGMNGIAGPGIKPRDSHIKAFSIGSNEDVQPQYPVGIEATGIVNNKYGAWERTLTGERNNTTVAGAKFIKEISVSYQERLMEGDTTLLLPVLAYYGTGRLWDYHREKKTDTFKDSNRLNGYTDCLDGTANIKLMLNWFQKMTIQKYQRQEQNLGTIPELEAVYGAIEKCFSLAVGYDNVKVQYNLNTNELDVYYTTADKCRMKLPLNQLSDGYKGTISLVADIAYRMAVLNPQLLGRVVDETAGVVLIDEVDLHLHPAWQQRVLHDLQTIFPKVQFIVTTHAPAVIQSVRSENIRILTDDGILTPASQVYGKDIRSVEQEIMGVCGRLPEVEGKFREFYEALDRKDYESAQNVIDGLQDMIGEDSELTSMQVQLDMDSF